MERRVKVIYSAEIQNYKAAMEAAAAATGKTKKAAEDAGKASDVAGKAAESSGKKSSESAKLTAAEIAALAAAHKDAAAASGLQYSATGQLVDVNGKALSSQQAAAHGLASFSAETYLAAKALDEAAASTEEADGVLQQLVASATENSDAWETVGEVFLGVGASAAAGFGLAAKAAMGWESAWAGVTKTVDGSPEQMAALEGELRGLAKVLPSTHEDIAAVAEAAGQLGVKREDVAGFTKTMIDLGETTNLTADEAATSIAQISNVMGTMERDGSKGVERFSATLVALGNAGASTEAEILDMAQRLAGAGKLIGATESDVLALANAMASVGIESQLGGGVMSRVMQRMYGDVKTGGEGLENLARVAGVTSKDFAKAFETDPVRAVDMMVKGLGRVKDEGGNVMDTMTGLGIKGTEETSVILRLAGAGDLLADSLKLGDAAWESNSALAAEAAKRYETTESKVKIAWNNIKDAAIDAGAVLLPVVAGIAESAAGMAQAYGNLPGPVKGAITALGSVVGVAALGAGAFLTLTPKILDTVESFNRLAPAGGRARGALQSVGKAAGAAGAIATVTLILAKLAESDYMSKIDTGMGKVALALADVTSNSPGAANALDTLFKDRDGGDLINTVTDLESAIKRTFNRDGGQQFNDWGEGLVNMLSPVKVEGSVSILEGSFKRLDQGLADLVSSGKSEDAAKAFEKIKEAADNQGVSVEDLVKKFPEYGDALKQAEADAKAAGEGGDKAAAGIAAVGDASTDAAPLTEEVAKQLEEVGLSADGAVTDIEKFTQTLFNAGLLSLSASDAAIGYQDAIDKMTESVTKNGTTLDINTEAGRANQSAFNGLAQAAMTSAEAAATETLATQGSKAAQDQLQGSLRTSYDDLLKAAEGFVGAGDEADTMARKALGIPKNVNIDAWIADHASGTLEGIKGKADGLDGKKVNISVTTTYYDILKTKDERTANDYLDNSGMGSLGKSTGGILRGYSVGGQLPTSGPGTDTVDGFLGIDSVGIPRARLDAGEWIINSTSSERYNRELAAINVGTFPKLPGYANGGVLSREYSARDLGYTSSTSGASNAGPASFEGNLYLDSGEFLGKVRGVARQEANGAIVMADSQAKFRRVGRH